MIRIRHGRLIVTFLEEPGTERAFARTTRYCYVHQITLREVV